MARTRLFFCAAALGLLLWGCATPRTRPSDMQSGTDAVAPNKVEPQARTVFIQAERAFLARDFEKASRAFQSVRAKYPKARTAVMLSTYRLGTIHYLQEEYGAASREFQTFLRNYPNSDLSFDVRYNLAACEYSLGNYESAYKVLSTFKFSDVRAQGARRAEVVYQLTALTAEAVGNSGAAIAAYAAQAQLPIEERKREGIYSRVDAHLARLTTAAQLDRLLSEINEPVIRGKITQRMGQLVASLAPPSELGTPGTESAATPTLKGGGSADRMHVGVILPLSGNMARYGEKALEGILLAAESFQGNRDFDFKLHIEDSQSNPEVARRAVDKLYDRENVVGIIGPLSWNESVAVADRAQALGVLNISLTGKEGISSRGAYLFQNALTPRVQLESLINFCMKERNFRRFAILAPNNAYGKDMANEFWELVDKNGGRIVSYATYAPDEKDFQDYIRKMVGLEAPEKYRSMEMARLAEFKKEIKEKTGREPKGSLPPIIDFDALFLPDSPATVAQIAASLAYYEVTGVSLLGTTEWNSDQLFKRGGRYVEGALFPGALSPTTRNENQRNFMRLYAAAYGVAPDLLASQAYEAMHILVGALKGTSSSDRDEIVREVSRMDNYPTPLGSLTFDETRIARRKLSIFKLEGRGNIVEQ